MSRRARTSIKTLNLRNRRSFSTRRNEYGELIRHWWVLMDLGQLFPCVTVPTSKRKGWTFERAVLLAEVEDAN